MSFHRSIGRNATAGAISLVAISIDEAFGTGSAAPRAEERLSPRARVTIICGATLSLWLLIAVAAYALLR